ncbi:MAG: hypothetical protein D6679_01875 [Candidatus Hydrogenedentota bacterium]|nr:MAG: hypothetical protein D6679_01875 [Candidatus Hydrogenedentota bacterium]
MLASSGDSLFVLAVEGGGFNFGDVYSISGDLIRTHLRIPESLRPFDASSFGIVKNTLLVLDHDQSQIAAFSPDGRLTGRFQESDLFRTVREVRRRRQTAGERRPWLMGGFVVLLLLSLVALFLGLKDRFGKRPTALEQDSSQIVAWGKAFVSALIPAALLSFFTIGFVTMINPSEVDSVREWFPPTGLLLIFLSTVIIKWRYMERRRKPPSEKTLSPARVTADRSTTIKQYLIAAAVAFVAFPLIGSFTMLYPLFLPFGWGIVGLVLLPPLLFVLSTVTIKILLVERIWGRLASAPVCESETKTLSSDLRDSGKDPASVPDPELAPSPVSVPSKSKVPLALHQVILISLMIQLFFFNIEWEFLVLVLLATGLRSFSGFMSGGTEGIIAFLIGYAFVFVLVRRYGRRSPPDESRVVDVWRDRLLSASRIIASISGGYTSLRIGMSCYKVMALDSRPGYFGNGVVTAVIDSLRGGVIVGCLVFGALYLLIGLSMKFRQSVTAGTTKSATQRFLVGAIPAAIVILLSFLVFGGRPRYPGFGYASLFFGFGLSVFGMPLFLVWIAIRALGVKKGASLDSCSRMASPRHRFSLHAWSRFSLPYRRPGVPVFLRYSYFRGNRFPASARGKKETVGVGGASCWSPFQCCSTLSAPPAFGRESGLRLRAR